MSNVAMTWAWRQEGELGPKFVLVALAKDNANDADTCISFR